MSSSRILSDKMAWTDNLRAIELLDWETKPDDFDKLFESVIRLLLHRTHLTREQLISMVPEEDLRREVRVAASRFEERYISLTMFIYDWLRFRTLSHATMRKKGHTTGSRSVMEAKTEPVATHHVRSLSHELVRCNVCSAMIRADRLQRHVSKVHTSVGKQKNSSPRKTSAARRLVSGPTCGLGSVDAGEHKHVYTGRPDQIEMERGFQRCRFCGRPAMPGSDLCYSCESD